MAAPLTREEVAKLVPTDVHKVLRRVMLVDGFDLVCTILHALRHLLNSLTSARKEVRDQEPRITRSRGTGLGIQKF